MITMIPKDALTLAVNHGTSSRYYRDGEWLMFYAWVYHRFRVWNKNRRDNLCYEMLRDTSGIGFGTLDGFDRDPGERARECLAKLFARTGKKFFVEESSFLKSIGIRTWKDLEKEIRIPGWRPRDFPNQLWFLQKGRWFKKPGLNKYHPQARFCDQVVLYLDNECRWNVKFHYSYYRDGPSSWYAGVRQDRGESLKRFLDRVDKSIEEWFEPDVRSPSHRQDSERRWDRTYEASKELFFWPNEMWGNQHTSQFRIRLIDTLQRVEKGAVLCDGRIEITRERLRVLRQWIGADKRRKST